MATKQNMKTVQPRAISHRCAVHCMQACPSSHPRCSHGALPHEATSARPSPSQTLLLKVADAVGRHACALSKSDCLCCGRLAETANSSTVSTLSAVQTKLAPAPNEVTGDARRRLQFANLTASDCFKGDGCVSLLGKPSGTAGHMLLAGVELTARRHNALGQACQGNTVHLDLRTRRRTS